MSSHQPSVVEQMSDFALQAKYEIPQWANNPYQPPQDMAKITQRAIDLYLMSKQPNGEMGGIGWWQTANGYTAMALHDLRSGGKHNYSVITDALKQSESHRRGLINEFSDDSLWWAMCCLHIYSVGGDRWFLNTTKGIWQHVSKSICRRGQVQFHSQDMEGACYWTRRPDEDQINAISTGLFAELSVRLAGIVGKNSEKHPHLSRLLGHREASRDEYIEAARCSLGWVLRCRYRPHEGVAIGAAALLYEQLHEDEYMIIACHMARKSLQRKGWVEENGVLTEPDAYSKGNHDPEKNNDSVGFKAVLMRQLVTLREVIERTSCRVPGAAECASLIKTFVNINFQSQVERNTNGNGQYGPWWNGPFDLPTSHSQMAVLDVMAAVSGNR